MQSELEGGEQQRELRAVATVKVEGWIPLPTEWARTIQKVTLDIVEDSSQVVLETYESERADKKEFWETGSTEQVLEWL